MTSVIKQPCAYYEASHNSKSSRSEDSANKTFPVTRLVFKVDIASRKQDNSFILQDTF